MDTKEQTFKTTFITISSLGTNKASEQWEAVTGFSLFTHKACDVLVLTSLQVAVVLAATLSMGEILEKHLEQDALTPVLKQHQQNQNITPFFLPAFRETAFGGQGSKLLPGEAELLINLIKPLWSYFAWRKRKA